jgi:hypothetical protein
VLENKFTEVPVQRLGDLEVLITGIGFALTVPLTAILCEVAPELAIVIFPLGLPVAVAAILT